MQNGVVMYLIVSVTMFEYFSFPITTSIRENLLIYFVFNMSYVILIAFCICFNFAFVLFVHSADENIFLHVTTHVPALDNLPPSLQKGWNRSLNDTSIRVIKICGEHFKSSIDSLH